MTYFNFFASATHALCGYSLVKNDRNATYDIYANGGIGGVRGVFNARGAEVRSLQVGMMIRF